MRKLKILALTLSAMTLSSAASAAGWAACQNPNPPFFCTQPEQPTQGPQGPQGDQGPKGDKGPRGYAGAMDDKRMWKRHRTRIADSN